MDMYKLKFTKLQNEIFRLLCIKSGEQLNQRGIAEKLRVSPTAIAKALKDLEKEGLVLNKRERKINLNIVELNMEDKGVIELKRVENLKMLYESGLVQCLDDTFPGAVIILFGSYSYGEDTINSDIDIAVIGCNEKELDLDKFEALLEREIRINFYEGFKKIHKHLRNNLFNGIVLKGGIEL
ncbi:MAG: nucleotidyltransferase domain-containing protein [archaeon]